MINVIFAAPGRTSSYPSRVMFVARLSTEDNNSEPKRARIEAPLVLGFSADDKIGTIQPHNDALVVTLKIEGYDVKRVLVDQGSTVKIMYPDLYNGLNLKLEDLTAYNSPLVSFEGKTVTSRGQIRLPIQTGLDVVEVNFIVVDANFIVVDAYSLYTAIVAKPWLHALEAVSSTLHQKVKYPSNGQVKEIVGSQSMARQCMVAAILHRPNAESSASAERNLQQSITTVLPNNGPTKEAKCEDLEKVTIGNDSKKFFQVGSQLPPQERQKLIEFLRKNVDVFVWNVYEAPGVDSSFICHHLNVNPSVTPKKQSP